MNVLCRLALLFATAALTACAALGPRGEVPESRAYTDTEGTSLARIAAASRPPGEAAASGFRLLPVSGYAFSARTALAQRAERSLDAQYYHVHRDAAGATFLRELRDAARRGVRVRLLVDDFYAPAIDDWLLGLAAHDGVQVRLFNPIAQRAGPPLLRLLSAPGEFARVNHRMHNKLLVADNAVAVFGGRNIAEEYFASHGEANFIDLDVLGAGAVAQDLSRAFDRFWNSEHTWPLHRVVAPPRDAEAARRDFERDTAALPLRFPLAARDLLGAVPVPQELDGGRLSLAWSDAAVFADPPSKVDGVRVPGEPSAAMRGQLEMFERARSEVVIVNPYLVPSQLGMRMLEEGRRAGVRTVMVTNSLGSTDEPLAYFYYARKRLRMLRLGAELYELSPTLPRDMGAFVTPRHTLLRLHAKIGVVDRRWLVLGSVNLDARSAVVNTELGVAIDSPALAAQAMRLITGDGFRYLYRVHLSDDGSSERWEYTDAAGRKIVRDREPDFDLLLWLKLQLQSWLVDEELM